MRVSLAGLFVVARPRGSQCWVSSTQRASPSWPFSPSGYRRGGSPDRAGAWVAAVNALHMTAALAVEGALRAPAPIPALTATLVSASAHTFSRAWSNGCQCAGCPFRGARKSKPISSGERAPTRAMASASSVR